MNEEWSSASICIISKSMLPREVSNVLKMKESRSHEKGEPINKRRPDGPKRAENMWILESEIDKKSKPLDCHIGKLVEIIEERMESFKTLLPKCEIEIYCGFSSGNGQGGFVIKSGLLKRLAAIPIDIILDLYPPEKIDNF